MSTHVPFYKKYRLTVHSPEPRARESRAKSRVRFRAANERRRDRARGARRTIDDDCSSPRERAVCARYPYSSGNRRVVAAHRRRASIGRRRTRRWKAQGRWLRVWVASRRAGRRLVARPGPRRARRRPCARGSHSPSALVAMDVTTRCRSSAHDAEEGEAAIRMMDSDVAQHRGVYIRRAPLPRARPRAMPASLS